MFLFEEIQSDLSQEQLFGGKVLLALKTEAEIRTLGSHTFVKLNAKESLQSEIMQVIQQEKLFYCFFVFGHKEAPIFLSPLSHLKLRFENTFTIDGEQTWKNIIEKQYIPEVDYIKRFDQLFLDQTKDPHYLKTLHCFVFEQKLLNLKWSLSKAAQYNFLFTRKAKQEFGEKEAFVLEEEIEKPGILQRLEAKRNLEKIDNWHWDYLHQYSQQPDYRILLIGKPATKKKAIARILASTLKITYIHSKQLVQSFIKNTNQ